MEVSLAELDLPALRLEAWGTHGLMRDFNPLAPGRGASLVALGRRRVCAVRQEI